MIRSRVLTAAMAPGFFLICFLAANRLPAQADPKAADSASSPTIIQFSKEIKGGPYELVKITLDQLGRGKFEAKPSDGDEISRELEVRASTMQQLLASFQAAQFLTSTRDYESHMKVADMGTKTISLEENGRSREVHFNYTTDKNINLIANFFSGLVTTELRIDSLERAMKYDKLGLPDQMKALQAELDNHWLSETPLLLPVLRKIADNPSFFNMVQREAHELVLQIESANRSSMN